ncbi:glycosyltransferase family 4 protein [Chloroflexota bacterium]
MRLLFVADGRSPIALNWIRHFIESGYEVHLASTFPCRPELDLASFHLAPVAFSGLKSETKPGASATAKRQGIWGSATVRLRTRVRQWLGPLTLPSAAARLRGIITSVQPDLVHAMRIPYEGMLAALATPSQPLLVSVWGNDFTLHAPTTPLMRRYTRLALAGASALHTDCRRDLKLARKWGFAQEKPGVVLPGAGGIQLDMFYPPQRQGDGAKESARDLTVINPRGFRAYVHNQVFFQAAALVLASQPQARFVCPTMAGESQVLGWVQASGIEAQVDLLPRQSRQQMAELFRQSRVVVSPTSHDGTPNTLLEAMACGCLPVAGDIESLHEWITPGVNGLLVDPNDPKALAQAILAGLGDPILCQNAQTHNAQLIAERADYRVVMHRAEIFYQELVAGKNQ